MKKNKRGFLLHAFGNADMDYGRMSVCCALSIKTNLKHNSVTVVMDKWTKEWVEQTIPSEVLSKCFDRIIISEEKFKSGKRRHYDTPWVNFKAQFNNQSRTLTYDYSPYDETILLDIDYLVMNDSFDSVWGNNEDILINKNVIDLKGNTFGDITDQRLSSHGVPMYWATVVYFKKSPFAKAFFDLIEYVKDEYNFFQFLYGFKPGFYRNDFAFSVAVHVMNGYINKGIKPFPDDTLVMSYQKDSIAKIFDSDDILFLSHNVDEPWKNTLVRHKGVNIHIMNKRELLRMSEQYIEACMEKL